MRQKTCGKTLRRRSCNDFLHAKIGAIPAAAGRREPCCPTHQSIGSWVEDLGLNPRWIIKGKVISPADQFRLVLMKEEGSCL